MLLFYAKSLMLMLEIFATFWFPFTACCIALDGMQTSSQCRFVAIGMHFFDFFHRENLGYDAVSKVVLVGCLICMQS